MKKIIFTENAPAPIGPYNQAVLEAAGMTFENVVKTTIFIMNMNDFGSINSIYGSYFNEKTAPARETVQVACLPKNVNVEISMIAML